MPSYSRGDRVLVRYPFTDLTGSKVRPALVISGTHESHDLVIVSMTSRTSGLLSGEFLLTDYRVAGLKVCTAVKQGFYTLEQRLVLKLVGRRTQSDLDLLSRVILYWLGYQPAH